MRLIALLGLGMQAMVLAAPATASKSMMYKEEEWTIRDLSRSCGHRRHDDDRHGNDHDYDHDYEHGKDREKGRGKGRGHRHGKDHGKGYDHGRNGYHYDDRDGYDEGRKSQNGHYGSNRNGYNPHKHRNTEKPSRQHRDGKDGYHDDDRRKGYTASDESYGPRAKLSLNKTLDANGSAAIANATTQLHATTTTIRHGHDDEARCRWSFTVVTQQRGRQRCGFEAGRRASAAEVRCGGHFAVASSWSGQFGEDQGFTTLSVVDRERRLVVWPAYRDAQLEGGRVVRPDQSYVPQRLP
ncbi:hypothetical protein MCOR11_004109 [Pyricularia oryzae]|nr:hypothetical protein MCOR11_004109 [Pyricularia oryzae]